MLHSQHETAEARCAAGPVGEELPVASAMTASPPHREPVSVRIGVGQPQEPAPTAAAPAVLACVLQLPHARCPEGPLPASGKCLSGGAGSDSRTMLPGGHGPRCVPPVHGAGRTFATSHD